DRRRAGAPARRHPEGAVQPPLPGRDGRPREHGAAQAGEARDRADPHRAARPRYLQAESQELMSETNNEPVSDTPETPEVEERPTEVTDSTGTSGAAPPPAAEEVSAPVPVSDTKARSRRHVPRPERRTRTKPAREQPTTRKTITRLPKPEAERGRRQERRGVVVSDKGDKTIVVKVDVIKSTPKYKKVVRRAVKFHAHDEGNTAGVGDPAGIVEPRPLWKQKRCRLAEIVEKAR